MDVCCSSRAHGVCTLYLRAQRVSNRHALAVCRALCAEGQSCGTTRMADRCISCRRPPLTGGKGTLSLPFQIACFACLLPRSRFALTRSWFGTLCFRMPGPLCLHPLRACSASSNRHALAACAVLCTRCQTCAATRMPGRCLSCRRPPLTGGAGTYFYFFPDANTGQWSVAVLGIGFACVGASIQGTGQGRAEQGRQNTSCA